MEPNAVFRAAVGDHVSLTGHRPTDNRIVGCRTVPDVNTSATVAQRCDTVGLRADEVALNDRAGRIPAAVTKIDPVVIIAGDHVTDDGGVIGVGIDVDSVIRVAAIQRPTGICADVVAPDRIVDDVRPDLDPIPVAIARDHVAVGRRRSADRVA